MKYRLLELLQCVRCRGDLELAGEVTRKVPPAPGEIFSCKQFCSLDRTPRVPDIQRCAECSRIDIQTGTLACRGCGHSYPVIQSVPWLLEKGGDQQPGDVLSDTAALYSHIWSTGSPDAPPHPAHLEAMEEALGKSVVQGKMGLEAGSGSGNDTTAIAMRHPSVEIISLDISEGVYHTYHRTTGLSNVHVVRASVLAIPLKSDIFDFAYSYGVLHHTTDPEGGLREVVRVLRRGGVVSLYLYEDHADNPWKAIPLRLINAIRVVTTKLNARLLSGLCYLLSPFVVVVFSIPARIMFRYQATRRLAAQMPFNFGNSLFSLHTDLLDRFGAPVELRYGREKLVALLEACRLSNLITTKLRTIAGWAARGVKKLV